MTINNKINKIVVNFNFNFNAPININGEHLVDQVEAMKSKPETPQTTPTHYYRKHDYRPSSTPTCNEETQKKDRELRSQISSLQQGMKATNEINKSLEKGLNDTSARVLEQKEVIERQRKTIESLEKESKKREDEMDDKIHKMKACIELCKSYHQLASELEKKFDNLQVAMDKLFG